MNLKVILIGGGVEYEESWFSKARLRPDEYRSCGGAREVGKNEIK